MIMVLLKMLIEDYVGHQRHTLLSGNHCHDDDDVLDVHDLGAHHDHDFAKNVGRGLCWPPW